MTTTNTEELLKEALSLNPVEKAKLVEELMASLDQPDQEIDALWIKESEKRLKSYHKGELKSVTLKQVLSKYTK